MRKLIRDFLLADRNSAMEGLAFLGSLSQEERTSLNRFLALNGM